MGVHAGQTFTLRAHGEIDLWSDCHDPTETGFPCHVYRFGPAGTPAALGLTEGAVYPLPDEPIGALVGRIGEEGAPFLVGDGGTFTADVDGSLQFRINDVVYLEDNAGAFVVLIDLE